MSRRAPEIVGGGLSAGLPTARMTTGERYSGHVQFMGRGVARWCCKCGIHKSTAGGQSIKRGPQRWFTCADCLSIESAAAA